MEAASFYWMDTQKLENEAFFLRYYEMLSPARRKKVDSCVTMQDKRLSLAAGILMDRGLSAYGLCERSAVVLYKENGKPWLPQYPDIHFNLAHSGSRVMAVFADMETGCAIEQIQKADLHLAKKFFTPKEYAYLMEQEEGALRNETFCRLWVLKESFLKAVGGGALFPPDSFEMTISPRGKIGVRQEIDRAIYSFEEYGLEGYFAAVCFRRGNFKI